MMGITLHWKDILVFLPESTGQEVKGNLPNKIQKAKKKLTAVFTFPYSIQNK